ncbi:hypothetical protein T484DRAFT_1894507 [Baffinella frigidus]|nr:hypothetical protein T484DRAFT_1894507 [Cryptophyta sp. CCMP2293]
MCGQDSVQTLLAEGVRELSLFNSAVGDEGITAFADHLADHAGEGVLEKVSLGGNVLSPKSMVRVSEWLRFDQSLRTLDLQLNRIGDAGVRLLAGSLVHSKSLSALNLQGNLISVAGVEVLVAAVRARPPEHAVLEELWLGFNPLGDEAAVCLSTLALSNGGRALKSLDLCKTELSEDGAKLLLHHVQSDESAWARLDLSFNAISEQTMASFARAKVQAEEARKGSLSSSAAQRHVGIWRTMPPPIGKRAPAPSARDPAPTDTLQRAAAMGPLYGGQLVAGPRGGFQHAGNMHGMLRDEYGITVAAARGGIKHGDGLDFLRDRGGRGTVYGWGGGQEEGLRAVARGVGDGKGPNHIQVRGLKQAPVNLWQGK